MIMLFVGWSHVEGHDIKVEVIDISGAWISKKIHVYSYISKKGFSNMASDWLAALLPANQEPGFKILVNYHGSNIAFYSLGKFT